MFKWSKGRGEARRLGMTWRGREKEGIEPWSSGRLAHLLEKGMPGSCVEVATPVFVEAMSWSTVLLGDVERLFKAEIVL